MNELVFCFRSSRVTFKEKNKNFSKFLNDEIEFMIGRMMLEKLMN